jgi:hypothetical protein
MAKKAKTNTKANTEKKNGPISNEEEKYIRENANKMTLADLARKMNRLPKTIERYCVKNAIKYGGMDQDTFDTQVLKEKLEGRTYWKEVKKQFTNEELEYFINTWVHMMKQFKEDIMYTEELQVKQWITLEIMANKVLENRRDSEDQIVRLNDPLVKEYMKPEEDRDVGRIVSLEQEIATIRNGQTSYTTEHAKILDKIKDIQKELKAARTDRIKKIEDGKASFVAFLKAMEDEQYRQSVGEEAEIHRMAKDEAFKKFGKYHTYGDGQVDRPLLNADTIEFDGDE